MARAIRGRSRDMIALVILLVAGLATMLVIIGQQKASLPGWVPIFGQDFFELKADFLPAQAVTPGQGQAIDISGIQVGKIGNVNLENGHAVVRMDIKPKYAPLIHRDASLLLRPKTGLNDMVIEMDPGTHGREIKEGSTVPLASTLPQVNSDQVLASLDADTRNYLTLLLQGGAEGLGGKRKGLELSSTLRRLEPTTRDIAKINTAVATRRHELARVIHNFGLLSQELGKHDQQLTRFVGSSNTVFASFARQQNAIRSSLQELPSTLQATNKGLGASDKLSLTLRKALPPLIPSAAALKPGLIATQRLFSDTLPPIRDQIRPFTRQVRTPVEHLVAGAEPLNKSVTGLKTALGNLNYAFNELAYNPNPSIGNYLFYLGWLNHDLNSVYLNQDAYGPLRRGVIMSSCFTSTVAETVNATHPFDNTLSQLAHLANKAEAC
jgi:phospholipid/cholesterol/gamma-HCH transport system substrate-binding protein